MREAVFVPSCGAGIRPRGKAEFAGRTVLASGVFVRIRYEAGDTVALRDAEWRCLVLKTALPDIACEIETDPVAASTPAMNRNRNWTTSSGAVTAPAE
ncbi:hypothetical protein GCM10023209_26270 [Roseibacterium beibuensis]|uniref:Uncharacterized protein n=1 Tax=[Roseibacterium] beibuensis TaxID=1193142 RepID=A0ABP9LIB7_9RHOB